ncbi:phosphate ABC transporter substrate-binding protein PstS [Prauserella sp. PE36]|uniref:Phosphate-binding protein n=1 Tax=Prauserella endophytica TaxID=1592324 RepID=A0ABY2SC29_9PSEU|nr:MULTISPECIES: phosphate ABC transporter substrate-binding protein PstS [Prauserella]PXY34514.1 phosphate ABC transporter substrate-binding protein PstS [Prauserella coralliicola]RBM13028.1 phosphate ABC transporter substrate-binding protein PstS [Prauserella sp. PE36]TKG73051.1 phosphate ABC transporter substrate-binding protein PstS [Prauserella endophytica]
MKRTTLGRVFALPAAAALTFGLVACGSANEQGDNSGSGGEGSGLSGTISGAGASSQEAAQQAWQAGFIGQHPDVTVNYDPIGSGGGREQFVSGGSDFGGSDAYLDEDELAKAKERCGEVVEIPTYVSPIAVIFKLDGVDQLNLKPATIAKIFNQQITKWNDPAIAADNPGVQLPDTAITPVNRSDESGTTENFVEYLKATAAADWPHEVSGDWPVQGGEAAQGTSGVVQAVSNGNGTIGYADASQASELSTAKVGVGDQFVEYSPEAAAAVLDVSQRHEGRGDYSFAYDLARDTTEAGTYPIVLVSYGIACANYDNAEKAELVKSYFNYMISAEGQKASADAAGSAPISDQLRQQIKPAVDAISAAG